jgi:hypothetical protein
MSASPPAFNIGDQMRDAPASPGPNSARSARRVAPPPAAGVAADAPLEPWSCCLQERLGPTRIIDYRTHLGCADPDRMSPPSPAVWRAFWRERRRLNHLTWLLVAGTCSGVIAGEIIRRAALRRPRVRARRGRRAPSARPLARARKPAPAAQPPDTHPPRTLRDLALSLVVGIVGGVYGIGGGSILAPTCSPWATSPMRSRPPRSPLRS